MTVATDADYALIRTLRDAGVLKDLEGDRIPAERGTIIVSCADGNRITDLLRHHWGVCKGGDCHHTLALNGGPLLIPRDSPVAQHGEGPVLLAHILGSCKLKEISTIVAYAHWPCGAAITSHVSLEQALQWYVHAKDNIRRYLKAHDLEPFVISCFHVDYGNGRKSSYFFDRRAWQEWRTQKARAA